MIIIASFLLNTLVLQDMAATWTQDNNKSGANDVVGSEEDEEWKKSEGVQHQYAYASSELPQSESKSGSNLDSRSKSVLRSRVYEGDVDGDSEIEVGSEFFIYTPTADELADSSLWRPIQGQPSGSKVALESSASSAPRSSMKSPFVNRSVDTQQQHRGGQQTTSSPAAPSQSEGARDESSAATTQPASVRISIHERPYCIGHKMLGSESTFNWLCQGNQLIRVPKDLWPNPVSL